MVRVKQEGPVDDVEANLEQDSGRQRQRNRTGQRPDPRRISSRTTAWVMPESLARPTACTFTTVRMVAPAPGRPPSSAAVELPMPWPISSRMTRQRFHRLSHVSRRVGRHGGGLRQELHNRRWVSALAVDAGGAAVVIGSVLGSLVPVSRLAGLTPRGNTRHRGKSIGLWRLCRAVAAPQPPGRTLPIDQPDLPGSRTIHSVSHRSGNREPETG